MYFYASRNDKNGNKLVTSYGKQEQAKKYGGTDAVISKGIHYLSDEGTATKEETNLILRSKLECKNVGQPSDKSGEGRFCLFLAQDGKFVETEHSFDTYGAANSGMKALAPALGTMAVVEKISNFREDDSPADESVRDESPF